MIMVDSYYLWFQQNLYCNGIPYVKSEMLILKVQCIPLQKKKIAALL